jgi:hypothetical protein
MNNYFALNELRAVIELLRRENVEMDEDEQLFCDMVEGCTNLNEFIHKHVRGYFDARAISEALRVRADKIERRADGHKSWVKKARDLGHITEKQTFPEGTVYERKQPKELIVSEPDLVPVEFLKVDKIKLRASLKDKVTNYARLVPSNDPPSLIIGK